MEKQIKTIGVLTSGGDAPGMNAAVRAVVRTGLHKGYRMIGIQRGYNGLLNGECFEMNLRSVSNIISAGGTILYTARCLEFKTKEGQDKGAEKCRELRIDALVVIGGDGSYRGARELAHRGIPMIGLPGTIDNDIACTDPKVAGDRLLPCLPLHFLLLTLHLYHCCHSLLINIPWPIPLSCIKLNPFS